jgi:hypothetical protein
MQNVAACRTLWSALSCCWCCASWLLEQRLLHFTGADVQNVHTHWCADMQSAVPCAPLQDIVERFELLLVLCFVAA